MVEKKDKKKESLFLLVIIIFLIIIIIWQIILRVFPSSQIIKEDSLIKELENSTSNVIEKFNNLGSLFDNLNFNSKINNTVLNNSLVNDNLTNEQKEIIKNKIFQYLNKENNNER